MREAMGVKEEKKSLNDQLKELQARADQGLVQKRPYDSVIDLS